MDEGIAQDARPTRGVVLGRLRARGDSGSTPGMSPLLQHPVHGFATRRLFLKGPLAAAVALFVFAIAGADRWVVLIGYTLVVSLQLWGFVVLRPWFEYQRRCLVEVVHETPTGMHVHVPWWDEMTRRIVVVVTTHETDGDPPARHVVEVVREPWTRLDLDLPELPAHPAGFEVWIGQKGEFWWVVEESLEDDDHARRVVAAESVVREGTLAIESHTSRATMKAGGTASHQLLEMDGARGRRARFTGGLVPVSEGRARVAVMLAAGLLALPLIWLIAVDAATWELALSAAIIGIVPAIVLGLSTSFRVAEWRKSVDWADAGLIEGGSVGWPEPHAVTVLPRGGDVTALEVGLFESSPSDPRRRSLHRAERIVMHPPSSEATVLFRLEPGLRAHLTHRPHDPSHTWIIVVAIQLASGGVVHAERPIPITGRLGVPVSAPRTLVAGGARTVEPPAAPATGWPVLPLVGVDGDASGFHGVHFGA